MALLYDAVLRPSKTELISLWAPTQPWFAGDATAEVTRVAAYRFDDPDGEVGIETLLVRAGGGPLLQVALTYRGAPLAGAEDWLIGTMSHSVLGERWVYDAVGDPVYLTAVTTAALTGGHQAEQFLARADDRAGAQQVRVEPSVQVVGSGSAGSPVPPVGSPILTHHEPGITVATAGRLRVVLRREIGASAAHDDTATPDAAPPATLSATWPGQQHPCNLVTVTA
ncbi:hypothetical protein D6T64_08965 [Cryobacterium melibiosiphilum]|uniref:Maltokinase N-terminal cap domain-containing protein n=1 Tax=Cryobacterium melibiosiphilum TaxID=995039 RepID=A0A3A5MFG8_9MICO|nr:hypothetical protein [Cryobacterium melibiosiphilum]RJT88900.1 hypothetical protein D6T64_08965 [Cryobacterium melibiosiphilum]